MKRLDIEAVHSEIEKLGTWQRSLIGFLVGRFSTLHDFLVKQEHGSERMWGSRELTKSCWKLNDPITDARNTLGTIMLTQAQNRAACTWT
eukprot:538759-Pelagomonas_calceolata.AAC.1